MGLRLIGSVYVYEDGTGKLVSTVGVVSPGLFHYLAGNAINS